MDIDTDIILQTYDLADMINQSEEVMEYQKYKIAMDNDPEVIQLKKRLAKEKDQFEEVQRFGHFHPSYHEVKDRVDLTLAAVANNETVKKYKQAEENLEELLYMVSETIAHSVSKSIKVPGKLDLGGSSSCSTGGCSSCSLGNSCAIS